MNRKAIGETVLDIIFASALMLLFLMPVNYEILPYALAASAGAVLVSKGILSGVSGLYGYAVYFLLVPAYSVLNLFTSLSLPFIMLKKGNSGVIDTINPVKADNDWKRLIYICNSYYLDNSMPLQFNGNRISVFTFASIIKFRRRR